MNTKTFNMSLPEDFLAKVDKHAKARYLSRSGLIREALRRYIQDADTWEDIFRYGREKAKELGITSEEQINQIVWEYRHGKNKAKSSS